MFVVCCACTHFSPSNLYFCFSSTFLLYFYFLNNFILIIISLCAGRLQPNGHDQQHLLRPPHTHPRCVLVQWLPLPVEVQSAERQKGWRRCVALFLAGLCFKHGFLFFLHSIPLHLHLRSSSSSHIHSPTYPPIHRPLGVPAPNAAVRPAQDAAARPRPHAGLSERGCRHHPARAHHAQELWPGHRGRPGV